jgi:undecaprenyl-diphosphatase
MAIIIVATDVMKEEVARPRPAGGLVDFGKLAFPSAHASYSTIYLWLAVTVVVRLRAGLTYATAVVLAGIALTAAIGLTRVYLGVHYLSDVSAGWALGVSAFASCAAVSLVVSHLRQNWRRGAGRDRT